MRALEVWLLEYLVNALWQVPLVFAAAWTASRMLRRADVRQEHRIWVGALLLQVVLPAFHLRIAAVWQALLAFLPALLPWTRAGLGPGEIRVVLGPATLSSGVLHLPAVLLGGMAVIYGCILVYFAVRLGWGLWQTRTIARTATRAPMTGHFAARWAKCVDRLAIAPLPEIAASPLVVGPVTVGLRRGIVLVPPAFLDHVSSDDLDAVLAHELAHISRHDFAKNLVYGLVSLPIVWHPLLWRTRARLSESRELICDAMAAEAVAGRRQYARSLLRLASMLSVHPPVPTIHAIGILDATTDANTLERRVMTLSHKHIPMGRARRLLVAAAVSFVALATCGSALALHTGIADPIPAAQSAPPKSLHVESGIMAGSKISGSNPAYPAEAKAKKIQGAVVLSATISKEGAIEHLKVLKSPDKLLSASAIDAVRTWHYRPYLLNGNPVVVDTTINVIYNLGG